RPASCLPSSRQLCPASVDLRIPTPVSASSAWLSSPVPAYRIRPVASIARAPIPSDAASSVSGNQLAPPSTVFHTPPPAAPAYTIRGSVGSATMLVIRPLALPYSPRNELPQQISLPIGAGPIDRHWPAVASPCHGSASGP